MKKFKVFILMLLSTTLLVSMKFSYNVNEYPALYQTQVNSFQVEQLQLIKSIRNRSAITENDVKVFKDQIAETRLKLKAIDFWLRYFDPITYNKINGPLAVEWENEVFEKFEKPYKREGAGLSLSELYLKEPNPQRDTLLHLLQESINATEVFLSDSMRTVLMKPDHFFFANRLFLLNLAAIYTTGFECPDPDRIVIELQSMLESVKKIYTAFNNTFPSDTITQNYLGLYSRMQEFVTIQSKDPAQFDHFHFIKDYVNPLYSINQQLIRSYHVISKSYNDYSLSNRNNSIFSKNLYTGQNSKGIFIAVDDSESLSQIKNVGKLLFFDPILSGNGKRSCASCHIPAEYFTDTSAAMAMQMNGVSRVLRNTPSLINADHNHLLMADGKHFSLQNQAKDVITNSIEMGSDSQEVLTRIMSCAVYKKAFLKLARLTPVYPEVSMDHVVSAITLYYSSFNDFTSPFDRAMNGKEDMSEESIAGFNLFMSKAQCATCHFVPQFNGVKPPYVSSEFEVLGVPADTAYKNLSSDSGRYKINAAFETLHAFRTVTIRNSTFTKPYMHNGIFSSMDEVINFYNDGGGVGRGLKVPNQTLSSDSLHLTREEKAELKAFIRTLDENYVSQPPPEKLPVTSLAKYKDRRVGGDY